LVPDCSKRAMSDIRSLDAGCIGPAEWTSLHVAAAVLPEQVPPSLWTEFRERLRLTTVFFGCASCRKHMKGHMDKNPLPGPAGATRATCFAYTVDMHNMTNRFLGKPHVALAEAVAAYEAIAAAPGTCSGPSVTTGGCAAEKASTTKAACSFITGCAVGSGNLPAGVPFHQAVANCQSGGYFVSTVVLACILAIVLVVVAFVIYRQTVQKGDWRGALQGLFRQGGPLHSVRFDLRHNRRRIIPHRLQLQAIVRAGK
jgi:hypothetical protein